MAQAVRQMKTINYQLSSQRCLEEGWTIRPPSPLNDSKEEDVFVPEPINPALISSGKFRDRPIIEKYYPDNKKFLTMFPDGSGNVFYPSGNLAIMVSTVSIGQYNYIIHDDNTEDTNPNILAVFEPSGFASCYYDNGAIRLHLDQYGGIELDYSGGKRRRWSWKDEENHVHAPPFQPIRFSLNHSIGVRVMSQANIILTLSVKTRSCRFNVGSRLRLVAPQNIPHKEIEDNYLFLEETKQRVDTLLDKVSTLLKFPKSPKIEKILPPLHITSKKQRNEKMKREKAGSVMTNKSKQTVTTTASVTVN